MEVLVVRPYLQATSFRPNSEVLLSLGLFDTQTSCLQLSAIGRFVRILVGHDGLASEFFTVETCLVNLVR